MLFVKLRPWLYQGNYKDATSFNELQKRDIRAILQFAVDAQHPGIKTLYLPFNDGYSIPPNYIEQGVAFVMENREQNVMIGCMAGVSRSTTFSAAVLKASEGLTLRDALYEIRSKHAMAQPHPKVWRSMCKFYGEPFNVDDLY